MYISSLRLGQIVYKNFEGSELNTFKARRTIISSTLKISLMTKGYRCESGIVIFA